MIIIAGTVDLDPAQREAALDAARPLFEPTLAQKGCRAYSWTADLLAPGRVQVYELWDGEAELAAHFEGPCYLKMRETMGAHGLRGANVSKYRSDRSEPVYDPSGRPRADFLSEA